MSKTLELSDDLAERLEAQTREGGYASPQEALSAALDTLAHTDREREAKIAWLRQAMQEGIDSGDFRPLDLDEIKRNGRARRTKLQKKA